MCLYSKNKQCKVAEEDITVYKVAFRRHNGSFVPPYHTETKYRLNETTVSEDFVDSIPSKTSIGTYVVNHGLHTYGDLDIAINSALMDYITVYSVLKCVIPKGTRYFKEERVLPITTMIKYSHYASEKLLPIEVAYDQDTDRYRIKGI